ncbi:hypothetical protein T484DRAFT_1790195, partial [Baffinella frigidus]
MRGSMALRLLVLTAILALAASARPLSREDGAEAEEEIVPIMGKSWVDSPVLSRGRDDNAERERGYAPRGESVEEEPVEEMRARAARRVEEASAMAHPTHMMSHAEGGEGGAAKKLAAEAEAQRSWFGDVAHQKHARANVEGVPADMREAMDTSQDPCDDFYEYSCGTFLKQEIPGYLTAFAKTWFEAKEGVQDKMIALLEKDPSNPGVFYRSCMDERAVEKEGNKPLHPWFKAVGEIDSMDKLSEFVGVMGLYNFGGFFGWDVKKSDDPSHNWFVMTHAGLTLPSRIYYVDDGEEYVRHRK